MWIHVLSLQSWRTNMKSLCCTWAQTSFESCKCPHMSREALIWMAKDVGSS